MPHYRRSKLSGGTYFFTVVTQDRAELLCTDVARGCLRNALTRCRERYPFALRAVVLLPDHLHAVWTLPDGDNDYSRRWAYVKRTFTTCWCARGGQERAVSDSKGNDRRRGVWQRRFWEATVRDVQQLRTLVDYVHFNPVKHGLVTCPSEWPYSTFHRYQRAGAYPSTWGCVEPLPTFDDVSQHVGE